MRSSPSPAGRFWLLVPLFAAAFLVWLNLVRIERVDFVTGVGGGSGAAPSAQSPSGYAGGIRSAIIPEHIASSFGWIQTTQRMLAGDGLRVRHIDYENAPHGRAVHTASPYRWWLASVTLVDHWLTGDPVGVSVERAARWADPLLHLLLLAGLTWYVARRFGRMAAATAGAATTAVFPFAAAFLPGVPEDFALSLLIAPWCVLPLLASLADAAYRRGGCIVAGIASGLGLWISVSVQVPLLVGIVLSGFVVGWMQRRATGEPVLAAGHWRAWSYAGALTVVAAYLVEYFPSHIGEWELRAIDPLYAVAWLGAGELLARFVEWMQRGRSAWSTRSIGCSIAAVAAVASLPVTMWKTGNQGYLAFDLLAFRLTKQTEGVMAPNLAGWFSASGMDAAKWATLLPLFLIGAAVWLLLRRASAAHHRIQLVLTLGPVLVALALAFQHLRWFQTLDAMLVVLAIIIATILSTTAAHRMLLWAWAIALTALCIPGILRLLPARDVATRSVLTLSEVEGLVERDLAHWLVRRSAGGETPVVHAPPSMTTGLSFYGGVNGLGTLDWENKDGLAVAIRVVISTSTDESRALLEQRGVTHIVLPSWDSFWDAYKNSASMQASELFFVTLDRWILPPWLRPIPYQMPGIPGFEQQWVRVFEVVEPQDDPVAVARLSEYFIEIGQIDNAELSLQLLRRYPADFSALVARAQVEVALGDDAAFASTLETLIPRLAAGADRGIPWDRRVSLAVVLTRGKKVELAHAQVKRCLGEMSESRLRTLTDYSLFHLLRIVHAMGLEITDPVLRTRALQALPPEIRSQL